MITARVTAIKSTFRRLLKLFIRFFFFLVLASNTASSIDPVTIKPSSLDKSWKGGILKKCTKRVNNNDYYQASYQERFLAQQKEQLENQVA